MCLCVVCVYAYTCTCLYTSTRAHTHLYLSVYMYVHVYSFILKSICTHLRAHIYMCASYTHARDCLLEQTTLAHAQNEEECRLKWKRQAGTHIPPPYTYLCTYMYTCTHLYLKVFVHIHAHADLFKRPTIEAKQT
jgi:hypothetical protein